MGRRLPLPAGQRTLSPALARDRRLPPPRPGALPPGRPARSCGWGAVDTVCGVSKTRPAGCPARSADPSPRSPGGRRLCSRCRGRVCAEPGTGETARGARARRDCSPGPRKSRLGSGRSGPSGGSRAEHRPDPTESGPGTHGSASARGCWWPRAESPSPARTGPACGSGGGMRCAGPSRRAAALPSTKAVVHGRSAASPGGLTPIRSAASASRGHIRFRFKHGFAEWTSSELPGDHTPLRKCSERGAERRKVSPRTLLASPGPCHKQCSDHTRRPPRHAAPQWVRDTPSCRATQVLGITLWRHTFPCFVLGQGQKAQKGQVMSKVPQPRATVFGNGAGACGLSSAADPSVMSPGALLSSHVSSRPPVDAACPSGTRPGSCSVGRCSANRSRRIQGADGARVSRPRGPVLRQLSLGARLRFGRTRVSVDAAETPEALLPSRRKESPTPAPHALHMAALRRSFSALGSVPGQANSLRVVPSSPSSG